MLYELNDKEKELLDSTWNFIDNFRISAISKNEYRKNIINILKNKYSIEEFNKYETITEKLYWNMFDILTKKLDMSNFNEKVYLSRDSNIKEKLLSRTSLGETTVKKAFVKNLYKYDYPNDIDIIMYSTMINRSVYDTIILNKDSITLDYLNDLIEPYTNPVEFDYGFPNLNTIKPFVFSEKERYDNIKKYYYDDNAYNNWKM